MILECILKAAKRRVSEATVRLRAGALRAIKEDGSALSDMSPELLMLDDILAREQARLARIEYALGAA
jgi:hypothetical protein